MAKIDLTAGNDALTVNGQFSYLDEIWGLEGDDSITLLTPTFAVIGGPGNDTLVNNIPSNIPPRNSVQLWYANSPGDLFVDLKSGTVRDGFGFTDSVAGFYSVHIGSLNNIVQILGTDRSEYYYIGGGIRGADLAKQYIDISPYGGTDIIRLGNTEVSIGFSQISEFLIYQQSSNRISIVTPSQWVNIDGTSGGLDSIVELQDRNGNILDSATLRSIRELASRGFGRTDDNDLITISSAVPLAMIQGGKGDDRITLNAETQGVLSEPGNDIYVNNFQSGVATLWFKKENVYEWGVSTPNDHLFVNLELGFIYDEWGYVDRVSGFRNTHTTEGQRQSIIGNSQSNEIWIGGGQGPDRVDIFGGEGVDTAIIANGGINRWISNGNSPSIVAFARSPEGGFSFIEVKYGAQSVIIGSDVEIIQLPISDTESRRYSFDELSKMATPTASELQYWFQQIDLSQPGATKSTEAIDSSGMTIRVESGTSVRAIGIQGELRIIGSERVKFSDKTIALDTDGVAGQAYRIYKAAFNRTPDSEGLGYWIANMDAGLSVVEVSARFIDSAEFRSLYGSNPSNADFLTKVYSNVLGRAPDPSGYAWWLNEMNTNPARTKAKVLADFAESPENISGTSSAMVNGISFASYSGPTITPTPPEPTYSLSSSLASANEGDTIVFTLLTQNVASGTSLNYTLSGVSAQDLSSGALTGGMTIDTSGKATLSLTLAQDQATEGTESLTLTVAGKTQSVSITDSSTTPAAPPPTPTYSLSVNQTTANEGDTLIFTLNTQNVAQGTVLQYEIGGVSAGDIVGAQLFGQVLVPNSQQARFSIALSQDGVTEGNETLRLSIANQFVEILVRDTSTGVVGQPGGSDDGGGGGGGGGG